ncbi:suppressor of glycerol defect, variant 2 [Basidiobolus ranarum]|uniref:Suppressor of glycerol defect, variant 2 n=1 Tax=Basidiobolus ranarum TaxID=34480 RepID=A0ABR2WZQ0_9FUNG
MPPTHRGGRRMGGAKKKSTTKMPQALMNEMSTQEQEDDRDFSKKFKNRAQSRKDKRKQARLQKKRQKAPTPKTEREPPMKRQKIEKVEEKKPAAKKVEKMNNQLEKLSKSNPNFFKLLQNSNLVEGTGASSTSDADELEMRRLESKLGIKKGGKLKQSFVEDGLDFILDGLKVGSSKLLSKSKKNDDDDDDDEDGDLHLQEHPTDEDSEGSEVMEDYDSDMDSEEIEDEDFDSEEVPMNDDDEDEEMGMSEEESEDEESEDNDEELDASEDDNEAQPEEDVSESKPEVKYIPPHLRNLQKDAGKSEQQIRLQRQLQGLINKLSETNMEAILSDIEEIYRKYSRNDVTTTITNLILSALSSKTNLIDSYLIINAGLVCSLYRIIGVEAGAHFVQTLVESFEEHHKKYSKMANVNQKNVDHDDEELFGKECNNLIMLIAELYNFQVISNTLVYDIIKVLIDDLNELNVELLLKLLKAAGHQLRQENPASFKEIILLIQADVAKRDSESMGSRLKFMIETMTNLKNNRVKASGSNSENVTRMKKFLNNLSKKRHVFGSEPLGVSLEDIHSIDVKGKWWLVGSSWVGHGEEISEAAKKVQKDEANEQLIELARKQNMNTDVRRSVFIILMTSDDYVDAFERLLKLGLKEIQEREIVRVLVQCSGNV